MNSDEIKKSDYRRIISKMGKKEFTFQKMKEYGFWPENLPTPYEKKNNETLEDYQKREELSRELEKITNELNEILSERNHLYQQINNLKRENNAAWDEEKVRKFIANLIMKESIARRKALKEKRKIEKQQKSQAWKKYKSENIIYIGRGYSNPKFLNDKINNEEKLKRNKMPVIKDDKELADFLGIEYKQLRYLTYHRDVVKFCNYYRYTSPKKSGGVRQIAAPKTILKKSQRKILDEILVKAGISRCAHGFVKERSIVSGAEIHKNPENTELLINMDLENFFPTVTFERVRGMFKTFGYSGYISSLLAMICTYCERTEMEIKGEKVYVKTSERILPQGSPASPMITNILCYKMDNRLEGLAEKYNFNYSRYADDMSFSFTKESLNNEISIGLLLSLISKIIKEENFKINDKKTKFLRPSNRQSITGIVINNNEIGVPKKWVKNLRAAIYNAEKTLQKGGNISKEKINEIKGKSAWLMYVNKDRYDRIIKDAENLIKKCL